MCDYVMLGELDPSLIEKEFGRLETSEVIVTFERIEHILAHHIEDAELFESYASGIISDPDLILKDSKNDLTAFYIKSTEDTNMNLIIRLSIENSGENRKHSVLTFYRLRDKNLEKLKSHCKPLYKRE